MKYTFKASDLTEEKSLFHIYKATREIEVNKFDFFFTLVISIFLFLNSFFLSPSPELLQAIRLWAPIAFGFTITTLGFLITGFTIFATINKPDLFLALMNIKHPKYNLTFLKYVYGVFMRVFIYFITWSIFYLIIILFGAENGLIEKVANLFGINLELKVFAVRVCYIMIGCSAIYLVLSIKTFIFNIYIMLMQALRWEMKR